MRPDPDLSGPCRPTLLVSTPSDKIGKPIPTLEKKRYNPTMPKNRFFPWLMLAAFLLAIPGLAQVLPGGSSASGPASLADSTELPPTEAEKALDAAIEKLKAVETTAADVELSADILGQSFRVVGQYMKAPNLRSLINLKVEGLGDVTGELQQVCDGIAFWDYQRVLESPRLRKVTLAPILKVLEKPEADATLKQSFLDNLGLAGPEAVLSGLRQSVMFDQMESGTLEEKAVVVIRGRWKDRVALAMPGGPQAAQGSGELPPYVPSIVTVWVGEEDGWPYQVKLEGRMPLIPMDDRVIGPSGRVEGRKSASKVEKPSSILMHYRKSDHEVRLSDFVFQVPPNVEAMDDTDQIVTLMENQLAEQALRRRREAAGAADSKSSKGAFEAPKLGPKNPSAPWGRTVSRDVPLVGSSSFLRGWNRRWVGRL